MGWMAAKQERDTREGEGGMTARTWSRYRYEEEETTRVSTSCNMERKRGGKRKEKRKAR